MYNFEGVACKTKVHWSVESKLMHLATFVNVLHFLGPIHDVRPSVECTSVLNGHVVSLTVLTFLWIFRR